MNWQRRVEELTRQREQLQRNLDTAEAMVETAMSYRDDVVGYLALNDRDMKTAKRRAEKEIKAELYASRNKMIGGRQDL